MSTHDKILATAEQRMATRYGTGAKAIPWNVIIEALLQILGGCFAKPTEVKAAAAKPGPFLKIRMRRQLRSMGVDRLDMERCMEAAFTVASEASEAEIMAMQEAAAECCK